MKTTVLLLGASLTLAGCAGGTVVDGGPGPATPPTFPQISISDVARYAHDLCGFAPAGQMIAEVLSTVVPGGPVVVSVATLGSAICAAYNSSAAPQTMARRRAREVVGGWVVTPGAVNGVPIR
jgi:hypothetical protein